MEGGGARDGESRYETIHPELLPSFSYGIKKAFCYCPISSGVGIGVVDVGYERRLANHLGAHRTPSILGIINGKVTFFHYAVAKEHLRQFVEGLLPLRLVEQVHRFAAGMTALQMLIEISTKTSWKVDETLFTISVPDY